MSTGLQKDIAATMVCGPAPQAVWRDNMDTSAPMHAGNAFKPRCFQCCKRVSVFLFSHVGLTLMVAAYSVLGAVIFMHLEAPYERHARSVMSKLRREHVNDLWRYTKSLNILHYQNWTTSAEDVFRDFQRQVYKAIKEQGWDGMDDVAEAELRWSFSGALLFSVTVITTIGKFTSV
jgi:hypothetical protein